jgi:hypothetical protein
MSARVFIVESPRPTIDVTSAQRFGELVPIFGPGSRRASVFQPAEYAADVLAALADLQYDPKVDYFIMTGALLPTAVALAAIAERHREVRLLMFSSHESVYVCRPYVVDRAVPAAR